MFIVVSLSLISLSSCKKALEESAANTQLDAANMAQTVGDLMAAVDETGGSTSGSFAYMKSELKTIARLAPNAVDKPSLMSVIIPSVQAGTQCSAVGFSGCISNVMLRTFSNCEIGTATMSGTITLDFQDATVDNTCSMTASGHLVNRIPNFDITTSQGAKLSVTTVAGTNGQYIFKTGVGQLYGVGNEGINRKLTFNGITLMDVTTTIPDSDRIVVSGTSRSGRTVNQGTVIITNNLNGKTCTLQPSNLVWNNSCNCPISGSWTGSCSDSGTTATLDITGCGTGNATLNGEIKSVDFDRCY